MKRIVITLLALGILAIPISIPESVVAKDDYLTYEELRKYEEKKAEEQWSRDLTAYAETLVGKRTGQCVLALRHYFGVPKNQISGAAKSNKPNAREGKVGAVIIFARMSWAGHVGLIIRDGGDGWYYFDSNGGWGQRGAIRWVAKNDPRITGYKIINYQK